MAPTYKPNTYQVVLQNVKVNDDEDSVPFSDGEYRLFANVGSEWFFLNEIPRVSNILDEGVGDLGSGESFAINKRSLVTLPPGGGTFRCHTDGWESDGIDTVMGRLSDQNHACNSALASALNNIMFSYSVGYHGCRDYPVGIVNRICTPPRLQMQNRTGDKGTFTRVQFSLKIHAEILTPITIMYCNILSPKLIEY